MIEWLAVGGNVIYFFESIQSSTCNTFRADMCWPTHLAVIQSTAPVGELYGQPVTGGLNHSGSLMLILLLARSNHVPPEFS